MFCLFLRMVVSSANNDSAIFILSFRKPLLAFSVMLGEVNAAESVVLQC